MSDPTAVQLRVNHTLTVMETELVFIEDARRRGELCQPLDRIPEIHHPVGSGEVVIPDALLYYRRGLVHGDNGSMLRAFVEVDRATMGPERLAAKPYSYKRLYRYVPVFSARRPTFREPAVEEWRRHYPLFPRLLFVLGSTGPAGAENRISALRAGPVCLRHPLHVRRSHPRGAAGRPAPARPLRTRAASRPASLPDLACLSVGVSADQPRSGL
ncbi:replication-relaxation family protein, partial [Streptomyces sp. NPDC005009]